MEVVTERLLILDDDPMIGQTIAFIAEAQGLETRSTTTASEFFSALDNWMPRFIALDLIMPDMDGVEVLVELARRGCHAQIIITSGVGARVLDAARRSASEHGLNILGVLAKPFSPGMLRELLKSDRPETQPVQPARRNGSNEPVILEELQQALEDHEFSLSYQPKVYCASGALAGFEALVRWESPSRGLVMPGDFIPLAEESGLIAPLTGQIVEMALTWFAGNFCNGSGSPFYGEHLPTISVNLSARTLDDPTFVDQVETRCTELGLPAEQIIFELTETSAMEDPVGSLDLLTRLRMKGFQLSIDDFGTGFSSMLQLVRLPFSEIKVDKSFVMTSSSSQESRAVIRSIVELGHSVGLRATAEGVEDSQALEFLKAIGCELAQGYHIARPLPGDQALAFAKMLSG